MANRRARGTPGNKSRTGLPKPPGSGITPLHAVAMKSLTILCPRQEWEVFAASRQQTLSEMIREAVADLMEQDDNEAND